MYENNFLDPAYITPEEQQILDGDIAVQKNLYTSKPDFVVESDKFLEHSEDDITLRRHTDLWIFRNISMTMWRFSIVSPVLSRMS